MSTFEGQKILNRDGTQGLEQGEEWACPPVLIFTSSLSFFSTREDTWTETGFLWHHQFRGNKLPFSSLEAWSLSSRAGVLFSPKVNTCVFLLGNSLLALARNVQIVELILLGPSNKWRQRPSLPPGASVCKPLAVLTGVCVPLITKSSLPSYAGKRHLSSLCGGQCNLF